MHSSGRRRLAALTLAPALLGLAACGNESALEPVRNVTAGPAGLNPSAGPSATTEPASGGEDGCADDGGQVPSGAGAAEVGDLDGDGAPDELWMVQDGGQKRLGVRTASGKVMSTAYESTEPASAVANRLGDGTAIILLNTGRSAALYSVLDCQIVATENQTGEQYSFDLGFGQFGTGVACPLSPADDTLYLAGYKATDSGRDGYENIVRTRIDLSEGGSRADNGTVAELGEYSSSSASAKIAHAVSCGDSGTVEEPA
ncbi:hypothetical protein [Kineosporia babensis]|uniref:Uncharacterized protein n=1 Tax=Kineosporia babensis TaxID=499548 RepID=A0A9X1NI31_9ACTN|nr:hypothetical protein [Kineosporia babensis]MCD5314543.1 hypothetical protein [Kineosporia babensis]